MIIHPGRGYFARKKKMKRILVPCDFSTPAEEAFKFAVKIVQQSKGELYVLHVLDITFLQGNPSLSHSYAFNVSFLKDMQQEANEKFHRMWEKYCPITLGVKFNHIIGTLIPDVEAYIQEKDIDLVVMGTHGAGSAGLGSNTKKIVRRSPVPVLAIHKAPEKDIENIVFPVLPDRDQEQLVLEVKKLQHFFQAKLHLLWINTPLIFKPDSESTHQLQQYAEQRFCDYTVNIRSDYTVESGITRFAREIDADMIAMGTHGWKGIINLLTGSIAADMVTHLTTPIWTCLTKND
jgi:nucleotide-binding universal stress UspA family protein